MKGQDDLHSNMPVAGGISKGGPVDVAATRAGSAVRAAIRRVGRPGRRQGSFVVVTVLLMVLTFKFFVKPRWQYDVVKVEEQPPGPGLELLASATDPVQGLSSGRPQDARSIDVSTERQKPTAPVLTTHEDEPKALLSNSSSASSSHSNSGVGLDSSSTLRSTPSRDADRGVSPPDDSTDKWVSPPGDSFPLHSSLQRLAIRAPEPYKLPRVQSCEAAWPTFVSFDRPSRTISITCPRSMHLSVNWAHREERPRDHDSDWRKISTGQRKTTKHYVLAEKWSPIQRGEGDHAQLHMSDDKDYAAIQCGDDPSRATTGSKTKMENMIQHNYVTAFAPSLVDASKFVSQEGKLRTAVKPTNLISIHLDSLSRAHAHRTMPELMGLIKEMSSGTVQQNVASSTHTAFELRFMNALQGGTAFNMIPLMAGQFYNDPTDDRSRVHWITQHIDEYLWDIANALGYVTSAGGMEGNGLWGSRTICTNCAIRPPVLPHWERGWVQHQLKGKNGKDSHLCEANWPLWRHLFDWTEGMLEYTDALGEDHPAFIHWSVGTMHAPNPDWALGIVDQSLTRWLRHILKLYPDTAFAIYGDHGRPLEFLTKEENDMEIANPFTALILPTSLREGFATLTQNQERPVTPFDIHHTLRGILHAHHKDAFNSPNASIEAIPSDAKYLTAGQPIPKEGQVAFDLLQTRVPKQRTCHDAAMPPAFCLFHTSKGSLWEELPMDGDWKRKSNDGAVYDLLVELRKGVQEMLDESINKDIVSLNKRRADHGQTPSACMPLTLDKIVGVKRRDVENPFKGFNAKSATSLHTSYAVQFHTVEGPTLWEAGIFVTSPRGQKPTFAADGALDHRSAYQRFDVCHEDMEIALKHCVCKQFGGKPVLHGTN